MVETPAAVAARAPRSPRRAAFLSIGTNDLTHAALGVDRFAPAQARPHHPRVLAPIAAHRARRHRAGIAVEVCGEAASDPVECRCCSASASTS